MNSIREIFKHSKLQKFFHSNENLVKSHLHIWEIDIVQLRLSIKEIWYIERYNKEFIISCNNFLNLFNHNHNYYYKNITFNSIQVSDKVANNCLVLHNSEKTEKRWYLKTWNFIKFKEWETRISIFDKIINLIKQKDFSVRNIQKLWITQLKSRNIYWYIKELWIFEINNENNNHKIYHFDRLNLIDKAIINEFLESV